jgi:hypothetical protein
LLSAAAPASGAAGAAAIPLPTAADQLLLASNPTSLLGPDRPGEVANKVPGPVDDVEDVRVAVGADGAPTSVIVNQMLVVTGVGDFSFKEPGPAVDVVAPPGSTTVPGLRRGAVIWEGFSPGRKVLAARVTLDPATERTKLPVRVEMSGGRVRVVNQTALPVTVADADPDPAAFDAAAAQALAALRAGRAPLGGADGMPVSIPTARANAVVARINKSQPAPVRVRGTISTGAQTVAVDVVLPSAAAPDGVWRVDGPAGSKPVVALTVTSALPDATVLADGSRPSRERLAALQDVIWQGLRASTSAAYLGNPRPGASTSTFHYLSGAASATAPSAAPAGADGPLERRPGAIALAAVAGLLVLLVGGALWARS